MLAESQSEEERQACKLQALQDHVFLQGQIPWKYAAAMYVALAAICIGVTPQLFPGVKAYYVLVGKLPSSSRQK